MSISYSRQPATLEEKIDKAIKLCYQIHSIGDSEFMRAFIIELLEKAYGDVLRDVNRGDGRFNPVEVEIASKIEELKREQQ